MKLTAEQFRDLCHDVQAARADLDSCLDNEAPARADRLLVLVQELRRVEPKRADRALSKLRDEVIYTAMLAHARRGYEDGAP